MKKHVSILLLTIPLLLSGCTKQERRERQDQPEDVEEIDVIPNASEINDDNISSVPSLFLRKLSEYNTYKAITSGSTISDLSLLKVTQSIDVTVIRSDYSYLLNESHSDMVDTLHTAYFKDKVTVSKDDNGDYQKLSLNDYLNIYGTYPFDSAIEGYSIGEEDIVSVSKVESEENYKFKIVFDKEKSTNNVKIQMKKFGGLDEYPIFKEDTEMIITVTNDFTPITLELSASYSAKKFLPTDCTQNYTVTYSNFNEEIEVPNLSEVIQLFDE